MVTANTGFSDDQLALWILSKLHSSMSSLIEHMQLVLPD